MTDKGTKYMPRYLEKIKVSRGERKVGEVFAMHFRGLGYIFGRVICNRCAIGPSPDAPAEGPWKLVEGVYLVYVFKGVFENIDHLPDLRPRNLLIPPKMIIGAGWTHGYFLPVVEQPLKLDEVLERHCFDRRIGSDGGPSLSRFVDEQGRKLPRRINPCSTLGLGSFGSLESQICVAIGIPPHKDWIQEA